MRVFVFYVTLLVVSGLLCVNIAWGNTSPIPESEWTPEARIWLARSCIGEAGWDQHHECAAIGWVYAIRSQRTPRYDFLGMVKAYSAAVKRRRAHPHPWLLELIPAATRPPSWPNGPQWKGHHDRRWKRTLQVVDLWATGAWPNPCQGADHYAGSVDRDRINPNWKRIRCNSPMRNQFYSSRRAR